MGKSKKDFKIDYQYQLVDLMPKNIWVLVGENKKLFVDLTGYSLYNLLSDRDDKALEVEFLQDKIIKLEDNSYVKSKSSA